MAKMLRRFTAISATSLNANTHTPSAPNNAVAFAAAYTVTANWINGFLPYSQLRYKVLPILDKYGVSRSLAYLFMAFVQYAYKHLVIKKDTTVEEVIERYYNIIYGDTDTRRGWLNISPENADSLLSELLELIGIRINVNPNA